MIRKIVQAIKNFFAEEKIIEVEQPKKKPLDPDYMPECPNGCCLMHPDFENNGFEPPEGAPHYEFTGFYCPVCGHKMSIEQADELQESESNE
jgi:hypothetical protein